MQILEAHCELLQDPGLLDATRSALAGGQSAAYCWQQAYSGQAQLLAHLDNPLLRERANDIRDVGQRVLGLLTGMVEDAAAVPAGSIVCAQDLTPSEAAAFDPQRVLGFCTTGGGATGHVAILARSLGLPALCAIDAQALDLADGSLVVLDASDGRLIARPDAGQLAQARAQMAALAHDRAASRRDAALAAVTRDGHRVEVAANVRNAQDARRRWPPAAMVSACCARNSFLKNAPMRPPRPSSVGLRGGGAGAGAAAHAGGAHAGCRRRQAAAVPAAAARGQPVPGRARHPRQLCLSRPIAHPTAGHPRCAAHAGCTSCFRWSRRSRNCARPAHAGRGNGGDRRGRPGAGGHHGRGAVGGAHGRMLCRGGRLLLHRHQ